MNGLLQDLRYAVRQLRKNVAFTIVAVTTLGLGIGANTAVFSALNALLLKLLPIRNPEQVYTVVLMNGGTQPPNTDGTGNGNTSFSLPVFQALRNQKRLFASARYPSKKRAKKSVETISPVSVFNLRAASGLWNRMRLSTHQLWF